MRCFIKSALCALLLLHGALASAQEMGSSVLKERYNRSLLLVPKIGVTNYSFVGSRSNIVNRRGVAAGMNVRIPAVWNEVTLESGIDYFEANGTSGQGAGKLNISLGYLSIPLKLLHQFYKTVHFNTYIKAGAAVAVLVSAETVRVRPMQDTSVRQDIKSSTHEKDYLSTLAIGAQSYLADGYLNIDVEYSKGTQRTFHGDQAKIEGFILHIGYTITI